MQSRSVFFVFFFPKYIWHIPIDFTLNYTEITSRSALRGPFLSDGICVLASPKTRGFFLCCNLCVFSAANNHVLASPKTHGFLSVEIRVFLGSQQSCASFG